MPSRRSWAPDALAFWSVCVAVSTWLLVGGDAPDRPLSLLLLALSGTWLLALTLWRGDPQPVALSWPTRALITAVLLLPFLQLVPLPPSIWQALPGRASAIWALGAVDAADGWRPLSLDVSATRQAALVCWWSVGIALAVDRLGTARVRQLFALLFALAMVHILIGVAQVVSRGAWLDFYHSSHRGFLLGFFANKNHSGLFIALTFLTGFAAMAEPVRHRRPGAPLVRWTIAIPVAVLLCAALLATNSRAGLLFGMVALGAVALLVWDRRLGRPARLVALGVLALIGLAAAFGSTDIASRSLGRFAMVRSDVRWAFWQHSWPLVGAYFPWGSGIGAFPTLFMTTEQLEWVGPTIFNHAHNDYLEQAIELGLAAPVLWALALAAIVPAGVLAWRQRHRSDGRLALIGGAMAFVILVHSGFDYPLRRPGTAMLFAVALAVLLRGRRIDAVARPREVCEASDRAGRGHGEHAGGPA